jgi:DNA helicase HerA-like ATPase
VLDLAGVPSEVLNVIVAVLCRMAFDFGLWNGHTVPVLLVCEEAHRYAPQAEGVGFDPAKRALARIAREGRKYGISLGVLSQRPSDLDASILSQCSTVLAFRMTNEKDQDIIQATMSDATTALFTSLPLLQFVRRLLLPLAEGRYPPGLPGQTRGELAGPEVGLERLFYRATLSPGRRHSG